MDQRSLNTDSFVLKKDAIPQNAFDRLLLDHPQVRKAIRDAARLVARTGIFDGSDAGRMFVEMVNNHIATLKQHGPH